MIGKGDLALVGVRLLGLYLVVEALAAIPFVIAHRPHVEVLLSIAGLLAIGSVLLYFGRPIAARLAGASVPDPAPASLNDLQAAAVALFGLALICLDLPWIVVRLLRDPESHGGLDEPPPTIWDDEAFVTGIIGLAIGVALFTGARFWSALIKRCRDFGVNPPAQETDTETK